MLGCMLRLPTFHHFHMRLKFGATFGLRVDSVTPSAPIFTPACAYLFLCRLANHNSYQTWSNAYMCNFFCEVMTFHRRGKRLQRWGDHSQIAPARHRGRPRAPFTLTSFSSPSSSLIFLTSLSYSSSNSILAHKTKTAFCLKIPHQKLNRKTLDFSPDFA